MNYFWVLLCFVFFSPLYAQPDEYYEKWYDADNSKLPQNSIMSIVKDKYGFLWLSTQDGIVRFDGNNFLVHDIGIPSVENRTLMIDGCAEDDWLFTFYNSGGIPSLITNRGYSVITDPKSPVFKDLMLRGNGNLWKLNRWVPRDSAGIKLFYFISKNKSYYLDYNKLFYQDHEKRRYVGTFDDRLFYRYFLLGDQLFYLKDGSSVEKIDQNGQVKQYKTGLKVAKNFDYFINIPNKQLLLRNDDKIYLIGYYNNQITTDLIYNGKTIRNLDIFKMYYDESTKTLCVGTFSKGLLVIRKKFIYPHITPDKSIFHSLTNNGLGRVLTSEGDMFDINGYIKTVSSPGTDKYGIVPLDNPGEFLLKGEHALFLRFGPKTKMIRDFTNNSSIYCISNTFGSKVWLSLLYKDRNLLGYVLIKDRKVAKEVFFNTKIGIKGIAKINDEEVLLAANEGLFIFNEKKRKFNTLISGTSFRSINNNGDEFFWVQSYGKGLYLYKEGKVYKPRHQKKILSSVHSVIDDKRGFYWLSSNHGLFQVRKQDLINSYLNGNHNFYIHKYTRRDGLLTSEFNGGANNNGVFNNGYVIFPSMNGMVYIDTKKAFPLLPAEDFFIDRIAINEKEKTVSGILNLERNFGYLKIFVDFVNFGNQRNNYIDYKIDDHGWQPLPDNRIININALTKGKHDIQVRKLKNFSSRYNYKTLNIYVRPAFWETDAFKISMAILVLLTFYLIYTLRLKQAEREAIILNEKIDERTAELNETIDSLSKTREELYAQLSRKKKLVAAISHDIRSPMNFINISTGILLDSLDDSVYEKRVISSIKESSAQILDFIDSTIRYNKIFVYDNYKSRENIVLRDFMTQRTGLFLNAAEFKFIQIQNNINAEDTVVSNPDVLSIVIHNILDNAVKYTNNGFIYIYSIKDECRFHLVIEDTGIGMSEQELCKINDTESFNSQQLGMKIIRELLPLIDVTFNIESKKEQGTKITLSFTI
ncbi:Signal transduction histidine kinase [Chryseobacterium taichungense]|uniref:histidine kinase n=1 Tax=Chryseobacterium taichungense TaxID=295069 RepID=A0A1H8DCT5_9FLAO|nr:ATP-binding protein [Chryseobacterium taichungense]SEN04297.1 Signal transduction histidine kinase [Chryseobacterium taichungense]